MRFYVATTLTNAARAEIVSDHLEAVEHENTYKWFEHGAVGDLGQEALRRVAQAEAEGVEFADVVIVLLPGGRGTHAELGMAIAHRKPILLWDETGAGFPIDNTTCSFYWHPLVHRRTGRLEGGLDDLRFTAEQMAASAEQWANRALVKARRAANWR